MLHLPCWLFLTPQSHADIKLETHARPNSAEQQSVVGTQQQHHIPLIGTQSFPLITSIPAPVSLTTSLCNVPAPLNTVPSSSLASSSLRLGQMPGLQQKGQSSDGAAAMDRDALAKAEVRRARRYTLASTR